MKVVRFHAPGDVRIEDAPEPDAGPGRGEDPRPQLLHLRHRREDLPVRPPPHRPAAGHGPRGRRRGRRGRRRRRPAGHAGDRVQVIAAIPCGRVRRVPARPDDGLPQPGVDRLPLRRRLRRVHGRAGQGARRRRPEPDPRRRQLRRGVGGRAAGLRPQRPELARVGEGDDVVVIGSGPIGCLHVRLARARGAARVFLVDLNRRPARHGGRAGRARTPRSAPRRPTSSTRSCKLTDGRGADVVITAAASGAAQEQAIADGRAGRAGSASSAACPRTTRSSPATPTSCTTAS